MIEINEKLKTIEHILNNTDPMNISGPFSVGVDLGTSDIVVIVLDQAGLPVAAFLEWAEVVRDGVVLDYWNATQIVMRLLEASEKRLSMNIQEVVTSYPPGTDPRISENVIRAAGRRVKHIIDEPSSVCHLLKISDGAVVDIGGGTTGIAVVRNGNIISTSDEPTGGRHVTLTIAGNQHISFEEAERRKLNGEAGRLMPIIRPVFEKMADIIRTHLRDHDAGTLYLSGGTCCFPGIDAVFREELEDRQIVVPHNPLFLTPLAIASYREGNDG